MEIKTSEFFKNMKSIPPQGTREYEQLVSWEIEKIQGGISINGINISGWLYWHLNHWWIRVDALDSYGNDIRVPALPDLRDNEWIRAEALEKCRIERKGYMEVGARQGGKSEMEASYFGMNSVMFENTQNLMVCGNDNDLSLLKDKVDFGLKKVWNGINIPRLDKTWRLNQIRLGYKAPNGDDNIWSYIIIRNAKEGLNTEVSAGPTSRTFIMDEIGKYPFASTFKAAEPTFKGKFGWRAIPILIGTGGSFDDGKNAEDFFYNPDANNFLSFTDDKTNTKTCLFLSGIYRMDCKEPMSLDKWIEQDRGIKLEKTSELSKIIIHVADKQKAERLIKEEREASKGNPDRTLYLKQKMYYPLTVDECFLSDSNNIFDIEAAKRQKSRLMVQEKTGKPVVLYQDEDGGIKHSFTDMLPISNYPLKPNDLKDAPIIIYEFPMENPPYGLYTCGVDPYRQGQSAYSNSLGAVYIYKRMHDIIGDKYQDMFVASYCARPDKKDTWEEQARLLIKYYNARTLCENDDISFIEYMKAKGDSRYLEKQPEWLKEIVPNTTVSREFGVHRSAQKIIDYLHTCLKTYMEETFYTEKDDEGNIVKEFHGVSKIFDPVLLEEIIHYNDQDNFDRIVAAELAIAQAIKMDPLIGRIGGKDDARIAAIFKPRQRNVLFTESRGLFNKRKIRLFT